MTTHTQTPTCPDSHACDLAYHRETGYGVSCDCLCHLPTGQRMNAQHYIAQARERRSVSNNLKSIAADIRDSADPLNHELLDADRIERAAELLAPQGPRRLSDGYRLDHPSNTEIFPVTVISDTGIQQGTLHADDSITVAPEPTTPEPSIDQLRDWSDNGGMEATDGCVGVDDDGTCANTARQVGCVT
jgi:hypothetical protein